MIAGLLLVALATVSPTAYGARIETTADGPTKGTANPGEGVVINEVLPNPAAGETEFVELFNKGSTPVDVSAYTCEDGVGNKGTFRGTTIAPKGYLVVDFAGWLNNGGDTVKLIAGGVEVDSYTYSSSVTGKSWRRIPDGGEWSSSPQAGPSKGSANPATEATSSVGQAGSEPCGGTCNDGLCFGTWNIQNLGESKGGRPAVMEAIRSVLARYDLTAVQELSQMPNKPYVCGDNTKSVICASRPGTKTHTVVASPRIGDEQYVVMALDAVAQAAGTGSTYPDPSGIHSRPPHAFDVTVTKGGSSWRIVVATVHTSPSKATQEILNFPSVLEWMRETFPNSGSSSSGTTHYLIAGDFNADGSYFKDHDEWPNSVLGAAFAGYTLLTGNDEDSTVAASSNAYDRIIVDDALAQNAGTAQVFRLEDVDMTALRVEGCEMGYVPEELCTSDLTGLAWADVPYEHKTALAKELSDHHPVEVCLRG